MKVLCTFLIISILLVLYHTSVKIERFQADDTNLYDLVVKPQAFDLIKVSDAMIFKERTSTEIISILNMPKDIYVDTFKRDDCSGLMKDMFGHEYDIVYWRENQEYYDIVLHAPGKMYGYLIILQKNRVWSPKFVGFIFEDKLNMINGVGNLTRLSDFKVWPFTDENSSKV